ncbi:pentapeptide repeat-containing protein [Erythrobacter sp. YT30]|uniref:pentapeptide repeat-containing protein n=1 Tax=Erythrobacter sp. YT30 TaxID=1735012 RepID=UPI00076BE1C0|nr:pentapeptide repeat-containing protein [Erythrobacter sp. YT30]KWV92090.1 hypothetical protein AUC45_13165 [Erythrobacter sp. YT30]
MIAFGAFVCASGSGNAYAQAIQSTDDPRPSVLGDEFARETGAIVVTGKRLGEDNLFEPVEHSAESCLRNAPALGGDDPGFTIDASGLTKVRELERIRRKTRAGTIFVSGGSFVGADFRQAKLYNMCFFGTDFSQTQWFGTSAPGLGFVGVDLTGADMRNSNLPDVLFRNANLSVVRASRAKWKQGRLDGGWEGSLRELDLADADLTDFRFVCGVSAVDGCPLERSGISMVRANLRRASLHSFFSDDLDLTDARIDQSELSLDHLALLDDAKLVGPVVLRSLRRAVMLFPGEVTRLSQAKQPRMQVCEPAEPNAQIGFSTQPTALVMACNVPGSTMRNLLQSVALLEEEAKDTADYASQRAIWEQGRDACLAFNNGDQQIGCISNSYRSRQITLRTALGKPDWLSDGSYRLFLSREAAFPTDKGAPGLYSRVLPVLLDRASAAVIVRSDGQGGLEAKGIAVDGCYFEESNLAYEIEQAKIGFAAERRNRRKSVPQVEDSLLTIAGRSARVEPEGLERAAGQCASAIPFPLLEQIDLDDRLLATIWERF